MRHTPVTAAPLAKPETEAPDSTAETGTFIAVGLPGNLAQDLAHPNRLVEIAWPDLCAETFHQHKAVVVACPLIAAKGDSFQVIEALKELGYCGSVLVVAPKLPDPELVLAELRGMAPELSISLINP